MTVRTLVNNGASSNRVDIVFLGDGYTSSEISTTYTSHANALITYLFDESLLTQPFGQYAKFFNVHLIDVVSNQSGADNPGDGTTKDTALNSTYFYDGSTERLLYVDDVATNTALNDGLAGTSIDADMTFVTVNETKYGGGGGTHAVYAGGNSAALEVAVHEVGHSFANLADEYGGGTTYSGSEPSEVNVTTDPTGAKWSRWIDYQQEGIGTIGAYEGGRYFDQGVYRPSGDSKMRTLNNPFDAVSREAFILEFYKHVDPLDSYDFQGGSGTIVDVSSLSVTPIDANLITVDWYVDGILKVSNKTSVTMAEFGIGIGTHQISARAYDPTDWVRADRSDLEQTVNWTVRLDTTPAGGFTGDAGNNSFTSTSGDDTINGMGGVDTVTFSATRASATVTVNGTTITVVGAATGTDMLEGIERLVFSDGTFAFDLDGNAGQTYRLYQAAFDRTPDQSGLAHNVNLMDQGLSIFDMANAFIGSQEFQNTYGINVDNTAFVTLLYQNVLNRAPDQTGLDGWLSRLNSGTERKDVLFGFSESAENKALVGTAIADGIELA